LVAALAKGSVILPEPEGLCNGVFVDDVVQAALRAAVLPDLTQERFVISGADPFHWSDLLDGYVAILGQGSVRHVPLADLVAGLGPPPAEGADDSGPSAAARISAVARRLLGRDRFEHILRSFRRLLEKRGDMYPDHHLLEEFSGTGVCRIDHARRRLGYAPQYDLTRALAATKDHIVQLAAPRPPGRTEPDRG
jgi:nucleoside-diphosphate-sugar epimerase